VKVVPEMFDGLAWRAPINYIGDFPVMELLREPIPAVGLLVKRLVDVVGSALGLVLLAPVMALLAAMVRLDSPGPAIYRSWRVGRKGRKFLCYKLRTMVLNADELKEELRHMNERQGPLFKISDDPRVTRLGRWLRRSSLDELPQLWSVLKGDMSLVGPRPPVPEECAEYCPEDLRRLDVRPGITGLWQVYARLDPSFERALGLDLEYIEEWSLWLDAKILLRTIPTVLSGSGR
jgi:exopolysaccharide biosynthesis polyprenyl glycosylphosphotransferase